MFLLLVLFFSSFSSFFFLSSSDIFLAFSLSYFLCTRILSVFYLFPSINLPLFPTRILMHNSLFSCPLQLVSRCFLRLGTWRNGSLFIFPRNFLLCGQGLEEVLVSSLTMRRTSDCESDAVFSPFLSHLYFIRRSIALCPVLRLLRVLPKEFRRLRREK